MCACVPLFWIIQNHCIPYCMPSFEILIFTKYHLCLFVYLQAKPSPLPIHLALCTQSVKCYHEMCHELNTAPPVYGATIINWCSLAQTPGAMATMFKVVCFKWELADFNSLKIYMWLNGRMNTWMNEWMHEWMNELLIFCNSSNFTSSNEMPSPAIIVLKLFRTFFYIQLYTIMLKS